MAFERKGGRCGVSDLAIARLFRSARLLRSARLFRSWRLFRSAVVPQRAVVPQLAVVPQRGCSAARGCSAVGGCSAVCGCSAVRGCSAALLFLADHRKRFVPCSPLKPRHGQMKTEEKERRKNKEDRKRHVEQVTNARRHAALRRLPSSGPYYATLLRGLLSVP